MTILEYDEEDNEIKVSSTVWLGLLSKILRWAVDLHVNFDFSI